LANFCGVVAFSAQVYVVFRQAGRGVPGTLKVVVASPWCNV
jgi:hypothetical protein